MRDLFLFGIIILLLLFALKKPQVGILTWLWISVMNPHRLTYGWLYDFPLLDIVVAVTLLSALVNSRSMSKVKFHPAIGILIALYIWSTLTTIFAVSFEISLSDWSEFSKTLLLVMMILLFMNKKHWILALVAVYILSVGYYGFKGGLFTLISGGGMRVWGPLDSAWGDNNSVSVAMLLTMTVTLAFRHNFSKRWQRLACIGIAMTFLLALLGTQSRGGLVGLVGMSFFVVIRSQKKVLATFVLIIGLGLGLAFMPQSWYDRMKTIQTYEQDGSASTRLIQWKYAIDISLERPFFGNGFDAFYYQPYYYRYVADKDKNRAVHSIYFQLLGEQGYIGLMMFLAFGITLVVTAKRYAKISKDRKDLLWASSLLQATQFGIIGYAFNGLTVNVGYLDLYYYMFAFVMLLTSQVKSAVAKDLEGLAGSVRPPVGLGIIAR